MFSWFTGVLRLGTLPRRDDLDERSTLVVLFARFADEVGSGLLVVLMPTLRRRLGLSVQQVGWCFQALFGVAAMTEPVAGAAIDLVRRRPLLVWGATGWSAALLLAAGAPGYGWLLVAFGLVGLASGPLTQTADVVLVEGHPDAVERIAGRSTAIDTLGALLAPLGVAVAEGIGVDGRWLLVATGVAALGYAVLLSSTRLPSPPAVGGDGPAFRHVLAHVGEVVSDRRARPWLAALVLHELLDVPELFEPVWLADVVGASQAMVALHMAIGMAATFVSLVVLDRWLVRWDAERVLLACGLAALAVYPAWLLVPGLAAKLLLVGVRNAVLAPLWPILRSRALASVPGRAGTVSAVTSLLGLAPLAAGFGWLAGRIGLTAAMLVVTTGAVATVSLLARGLRPTTGRRGPEGGP
jgi:MFS family permease